MIGAQQLCDVNPSWRSCFTFLGIGFPTYNVRLSWTTPGVTGRIPEPLHVE